MPERYTLGSNPTGAEKRTSNTLFAHSLPYKLRETNLGDSIGSQSQGKSPA